MKVTLIGTMPPIKAISPYCIHLANALSKKIDLEFIGFKSIIPDFLYSGRAKEKTTTFTGIENAKTKNILSLNNPMTWIVAGLKAQGEIIHVQHWEWYSSMVYCVILPILKIRKKKIIITVHNITPHERIKSVIFADKIFNKIIFPLANMFIVHNLRNKEKFIKMYDIDERKISIATHGILKHYEIKNISKNRARELLNIPMNKKIILLFGYITEWKGLDIILKSLISIKNEIPDVALLIAGQPMKDWKKYEKMIHEYGLDNYVIKKLGYISDAEVETYFSAADIVALSYKKPFDTHGGVGALTVTFKKPLIVTNVGGLPEYVKDERAIANSDDADDLAKKITLVLKDEALLKKFSKDSEEISKELGWDKIADKTIESYERIVNINTYGFQ